MQGTLLWFNEAENYGFIATEEGERLYVDGSAFPGGKGIAGRCKGLEVTFEVVEGEERRSAADVSLVQHSPSQRARRRHGGRV